MSVRVLIGRCYRGTDGGGNQGGFIVLPRYGLIMAMPSDLPADLPSDLPAQPGSPPPITADDKNWTWVLERICPDCGFDAIGIAPSDVAGLVRGQIAEWRDLLARPDARLRPTADQWSALEYGCHVRDVFELFDHRLELMLAEDAPQFANWDQDQTAVDSRYDLQDPSVLADQLEAAAQVISARFEQVGDHQWVRTGRRSDGAEFTVDSFARYFLHDPLHHLDDVRRGNEILNNSGLD